MLNVCTHINVRMPCHPFFNKRLFLLLLLYLLAIGGHVTIIYTFERFNQRKQHSSSSSSTSYDQFHFCIGHRLLPAKRKRIVCIDKALKLPQTQKQSKGRQVSGTTNCLVCALYAIARNSCMDLYIYVYIL